jgi:hypothetical protein
MMRPRPLQQYDWDQASRASIKLAGVPTSQAKDCIFGDQKG